LPLILVLLLFLGNSLSFYLFFCDLSDTLQVNIIIFDNKSISEL
jgi:hypothetical protein